VSTAMRWLRGAPHYTPALLALIIAWECDTIVNTVIWAAICAACIMAGYEVRRGKHERNQDVAG
jgi:hypothetical protein